MPFSVQVDYTIEEFDKNTSAERFGEFASFKRLWDSKRHGDDLPAWRDFQFEDFSPWWGWITVEDIIPSEAYDAVYRLYGTRVAALFGTDMTAKRVSDMGNLTSTTLAD